MESIKSASGFVEKNNEKVIGNIKLGAIPTIAPYLLPKIIKAIKYEYPDINFELMEETTDVLIEKLRQGDLDFAILSPPTKIDQDVDFIDICDDELLLTLSAEHPLNKGKEITLDTLENEKILLLKEAHCLSNQVRSLCKMNSLNKEVVFKSSQISTLLGFVELGLGYTFTPKMAVEHHSGYLVKFHSITPQIHSRKIRIVWMNRHIPSTAQIAVLSCIKDNI